MYSAKEFSQARTCYARTGNVKKAFELAKEENWPYCLNTFKKIVKENKKEFDQAKKEYWKQYAAAEAQLAKADLDLTTDLINLKTRLNNALGESKDLKALSQVSFALTNMTKLLNDIEANKKTINWKSLQDNAIVQFLMGDPELKPLLIKKREKLVEFVTSRQKKERKHG